MSNTHVHDKNLKIACAYQQKQARSTIYIPKPLHDASFRAPERIMIKAHLFIKACSHKNRCNDEHVFLKHPHQFGL